MLITDQDLTHYVEEALPEPGYDVAGIVEALRPHVQFGDVDPSDYLTDDDDDQSYWHAVDKCSFLIDRMLKAAGLDGEALWRIVEAHDQASSSGWETEWEQVGTVEILRLRNYPLDASSDSVLATQALVEPGTYPVYRKCDAYCWLMTGRINERTAKIGDGLFEMNAGDKPTGLPVQFPSPVFGQQQFAEFLQKPACQPGPEQRLSFTLQPLALP
jgi:hypothetical protein